MDGLGRQLGTQSPCYVTVEMEARIHRINQCEWKYQVRHSPLKSQHTGKKHNGFPEQAG